MFDTCFRTFSSYKVAQLCLHIDRIYTANFPDAVTRGGDYDGRRAFALGLQGHVSCRSERQACVSSSGVGYSCWIQSSPHNVPSQLAPVQGIRVSKPKTSMAADGKESA